MFRFALMHVLFIQMLEDVFNLMLKNTQFVYLILHKTIEHCWLYTHSGSNSGAVIVL